MRFTTTAIGGTVNGMYLVDFNLALADHDLARDRFDYLPLFKLDPNGVYELIAARGRAISIEPRTRIGKGFL